MGTQVRRRGDKFHRPQVIFVKAQLTNELPVLDADLVKARQKLDDVLLQGKDPVVPASSAARGGRSIGKTGAARFHSLVNVRQLQRHRNHFSGLVYIHGQTFVNFGAVQGGKEVFSVLQDSIHGDVGRVRNQLHVRGGLAGALVLKEHGLRGLVEEQLEALFGPDDAVHRLVRSASDSANRIHLLCGLGIALVARRLAFQNRHDLSKISRRSGVNQRSVSSETETVDVSSGINVVECVEHQVELLEVRQVELGVLDILVVADNRQIRVEALCSVACNDCFGLTNMFWAEQKLPIQIGHIDGVQVNQLDILKTS
mmetsp:Transcript_39131/g.67754  ORF Transcript_39131/g.67754 Transcript_39131/m.67754 type:complete len:313 (-) Transcript_39131:161-1099(-)